MVVPTATVIRRSRRIGSSNLSGRTIFPFRFHHLQVIDRVCFGEGSPLVARGLHLVASARYSGRKDKRGELRHLGRFGALSAPVAVKFAVKFQYSWRSASIRVYRPI